MKGMGKHRLLQGPPDFGSLGASQLELLPALLVLPVPPESKLSYLPNYLDISHTPIHVDPVHRIITCVAHHCTPLPPERVLMESTTDSPFVVVIY